MVNMSLSELTSETLAAPSGRMEEEEVTELRSVTVDKAPKVVDGESSSSKVI